MSDDKENEFDFDDEPKVEEPAKEKPAASGPPEVKEQMLPEMTPGLRRRLQMCFDHGAKLMKELKYDYRHAAGPMLLVSF